MQGSSLVRFKAKEQVMVKVRVSARVRVRFNSSTHLTILPMWGAQAIMYIHKVVSFIKLFRVPGLKYIEVHNYANA